MRQRAEGEKKRAAGMKPTIRIKWVHEGDPESCNWRSRSYTGIESTEFQGKFLRGNFVLRVLGAKIFADGRP
jgi:hypothetical protein